MLTLWTQTNWEPRPRSFGKPLSDLRLTSCSQRSASPADSRLKLETGGSRLSTTTTTPSASTARFARKTWKVKASLSNLESLSARPTPEDEQKFFQTSSKTKTFS